MDIPESTLYTISFEVVFVMMMLFQYVVCEIVWYFCIEWDDSWDRKEKYVIYIYCLYYHLTKNCT